MFPKNSGTSKWMVYKGLNPINPWMIWGENPPIFGNTHLLKWKWPPFIYFGNLISEGRAIFAIWVLGFGRGRWKNYPLQGLLLCALLGWQKSLIITLFLVMFHQYFGTFMAKIYTNIYIYIIQQHVDTLEVPVDYFLFVKMLL